MTTWAALWLCVTAYEAVERVNEPWTVRTISRSSINNRPTGFVLATGDARSCIMRGVMIGQLWKKTSTLAGAAFSFGRLVNEPPFPFAFDASARCASCRARMCTCTCMCRVCARVYVTVRGHGNWNGWSTVSQFTKLDIIDYFEREQNKNPTCS